MVMTLPRTLISASTLLLVAAAATISGQGGGAGVRHDGKHLFEKETFGGNGRTCRTCHSAETGTVSPQDAADRLEADANDPLFVHDGSDDGAGNGTSRMLANATIRMEIPMRFNVRLADDPTARSVILLRGIPTTLNTPALDPVLMLDGRQPTLQRQAAGAIHDHAQVLVAPKEEDLDRIKQFQLTDAFFSSTALRDFARGGEAPSLPRGRTASERRGRRFFEDLPAGPDGKDGLCSVCHSGPLLNQTNKFLNDVGVNVPPGSRFQGVLVSELNKLGNPVRHFIFTNPDGSETDVFSADPGRALITGIANDFGTFDSLNAFKIPILRGVRGTAPYFHDNSAKTLEEVLDHYEQFFLIVSGGFLALTPQDKADIVAFMRLL
jgi:cytochrome c peroxidase